MKTYEFILGVLKYAGVILAAISSIWGAVNVISKEIEGRKKLTRAGKISLLLTIIGFTITITSNILQDNLNSRKAQEAAIKELKKTNKIILAGQPLLSLDFKLRFSKDNNLFQLLKTAESTAEADQMYQEGIKANSRLQAIKLRYFFYPLIAASLNGRLPQKSEKFLFLISLDNDQQTILPFGYLDDTTGLYFSNPNQGDAFPMGVVPDGESQKSAFFGHSGDIKHPQFYNDSNSVTLGWNLNSNTLFNCLDRLNSNIALTANLPAALKIAILYDIDTLPFSKWNTTASFEFNTWNEVKDLHGEVPLSHLYANSAIDLIPNQLSEQMAHYELKKAFQKKIQETDSGDYIGCNALLLIYNRVD